MISEEVRRPCSGLRKGEFLKTLAFSPVNGIQIQYLEDA